MQRGLSYTSLQEMSLIQSHGPDEVNLSLSHSTYHVFQTLSTSIYFGYLLYSNLNK